MEREGILAKAMMRKAVIHGAALAGQYQLRLQEA